MNKQILALFISWQLMPSPMAEPKQEAYMVWNKPCIIKIEQTEKVFIEAPMVDGEPDLKRAVIHGQIATYEPKCGVIEIRRVK
jgi:hypothetical protein